MRGAAFAARGESMKLPAASLLTCLLAATVLAAVPGPPTGPYDPSLDGLKQLRAAGSRAGREGKRLLVVVGGNWCPWCRALDRLMHANAGLNAELAKFEVVHLNWSKENKNPEAMARLGNPEKLGFPSFLVVSADLKVLRAQPTDAFETGDPKHPAHDPAKVGAFLKRWEPPR